MPPSNISELNLKNRPQELTYGVAMSQNESFESQLRRIVPFANGVSLEQVMYRAGYESGRQSAPSRATSWYSFAKGAISGVALTGVAASGIIVLMMYGSPRLDPESAQLATTTIEQKVTDEPMQVDTPEVVAPQNPFLPAFGQDPLEKSIHQIVKQRWSQQRLSERTKWVSVNESPSGKNPRANPSATTPKTLLELRSNLEWVESL
jgi:hypothetical protein